MSQAWQSFSVPRCCREPPRWHRPPRLTGMQPAKTATMTWAIGFCGCFAELVKIVGRRSPAVRAARALAGAPAAEALVAAMMTGAMMMEATMMAAAMTEEMMTEETTAAMMAATMTSRAYRGALANLRYQPSPAWVFRKMRCRVAASADVSALMMPGKAVLTR